MKRRKINESIYTENLTFQLTAAEENLAAQVLACNETITLQDFPVVLPGPTKTLPLYSPDTIKSLISTANTYILNPFYLKTKQSNINPKMTFILTDWMMEVCSDFHFLRETFHLSLFYVHSYLSSTENLPVTRLQLLGLGAVVLAAKFNEMRVPRLADAAKCAADCYTVDQLETMEIEIINTLAWRLAPTTTFFWTNLYATQWDEFSKDTECANMKFKEMSEDSYKRYRLLMQIVDLMSMEVEHLQYNQRILAGSSIYIVLSMYQYTVEEILKIFTKGSKFIFEPNIFNKAFECFAKTFLEFSLEELLPGVQYLATFVDMPFEDDDLMKWKGTLSNYEEMLCTQTYNRYQLDYFCARHTNS